MKLTVELVPSSSFYNNVRALVSKKEWDRIKSIVSSKAYNLCEICGGAGPKHPVECHEIWKYDDKKCIQKLEGMIALCPDCHSVKHFGLAELLGRRERAIKHLMKINNINLIQANEYVEKSFKKWTKRSKKSWKLDLSVLKEFNINMDNFVL